MGFSNAQIQTNSLPQLDDVVLKPISKRYLNIILINQSIFFAIIFTGLFLLRNFINHEEVQQVFWYIFSVITVLFVLNVLISILAFRKRKYAIREHDIIYSKGLVFNSITTVPLSRVQHIEESRSWLARQFNLATLNIFTAGESGSDLSIKGLPKDEARQINDFISAKTNGND